MILLTLRLARAHIAAKHAAIIREQPLQAQFLAFGHFHLYDDGLYEHLGTADIQPGDHGLQGRHLVGVSSNNQTISALVSLNGRIAIALTSIITAFLQP